MTSLNITFKIPNKSTRMFLTRSPVIRLGTEEGEEEWLEQQWHHIIRTCSSDNVCSSENYIAVVWISPKPCSAPRLMGLVIHV